MSIEKETVSQLQLRFKRNDITTVATTHRNTLRVLPSSKAKSRQKVAVGDVSGVVTCFGVGKHHELKPEFATTKPNERDSEVTSLTLFRDQIFAGVGRRISAFTKKGKPFYINETSLSEKLLHLEVNTPYQTVAGDFVLTVFRETADAGFYMSPDKINGMISVARDNEGRVEAFIAGQDRTVRCIRQTTMAHQMGCEAPVTAIAWNCKGDVKALENPMAALDLVYGTLSGSIGGLRAAPDGVTRRFSAIPQSRLAGITTIRTADLTQDGVNDVVVTREDGAIELHSFEMNPDGTPVTTWTGAVGEVVTSLDCGTVTTADRHDLVVSTFSGKVLTFSVTEEDQNTKAAIPSMLQGNAGDLPTLEGTAAAAKQAMQAGRNNGEDAPIAEVLKVKIQSTLEEIAQLKKDVVKKKNEYAGQEPNAKKVSSDKLRAVAATFSMRDRIYLDDSGTIVLSLELDTVLDTVNVTANVAFEVVEDAQSSDETRVSQTPLEWCKSSKSKLIATYRAPQETSQKNMTLRLRPTEGFSGQITVYVTPRTTPKSVLKRTFDIPALSLHQRFSEDLGNGQPDPSVDPALSTVVMTGSFSMKDAHAWMFRSFFDVPVNVGGEEARLAFRNTFSGVPLYVRYRRGELVMASHNLSALATLRDYITREAAARKVNLQFETRPGPQSLERMLESLDVFVAHEAKLARSVKILDALKEIEAQEGDVSFMAPEYREVLGSADAIQKAHASQPQRLQYVIGVLERLYADRSTFRDCAPATPARLQELNQIVTQNYSLPTLVRFFTN
uniref:Bardet-Biedl syndrome 7 protein homolog n=1 Tax=Neobodo designis TaxID=312471 RepID=A0A7S1W7H6_NEODS